MASVYTEGLLLTFFYVRLLLVVCMRAKCPVNLTLDLIPRTTLGEGYKLQCSTLCNTLTSLPQLFLSCQGSHALLISRSVRPAISSVKMRPLNPMCSDARLQCNLSPFLTTVRLSRQRDTNWS
jgi:hypothetical protein